MESRAATELRTYALRDAEALRYSPVLTATKRRDAPSSPDSIIAGAVPLPLCAGDTGMLSMDFIRTLQATSGTGHDFNFIGEYMAYIPQRLGHNAALDAATECLLFAYKALLRRDSICEEGQLSRYIRALRALRVELDGGTSSGETVGAPLLICAFEVRA